MTILGLESKKNNNSLYICNRNLKNNHNVTCDNKQMIRVDDIRYIPNNYEKQSNIKFHPLDEQKESCSRLIINDSIHLYLRNITYNIFREIITIKDGTNRIYNELDNIQLDKLTKTTKYKYYNLFNIVDATSFSKNLISFSIDLTISSKDAKVKFKYPLYDALSTIQDNIIFGIYLEDFEIKLFKKIYENYIIDIIDNLFKDTIKISEDSSNYPQFYILLKIRLMLEETFWKKYNISYIVNIKKKLSQYYEMLSNLNQLTLYTEHQQNLDQQSYRNELELRKESEPNWLLLKDNTMQNNVTTYKNDNTVIKELEQHFEQTYNRYIKKVNNFVLNESINDLIQNYQITKNNQEWSEIFYWQKLVLDILNLNGGALWFDTRIDKHCFRSKIGSKIVYEGKDKIGELLTRALQEKITNFLNRNNNGFLSSYAIEIVLVSKLKGINNQKLNINERASNVIKILVFENEIFTIDEDTFDTQSPYEFSQNNGDLFYTQNRFIPTKYLRKRFDNLPLLLNNTTIGFTEHFKYDEDTYSLERIGKNIEQLIDIEQLSFIEKFLFYLVNEDYHTYLYLMNWLSTFFNKLQKSGTALVLLGDQEVTQNILWDKIIKEIFGLQHCITINDEECKTASSFDIAKDKLFFHIADITNPATKFDDETLYKLVKDLLVKPSILILNENNEEDEATVHGQMIITAKNPFPYIKRTMSKCTIIKVNDMDTIIEKLGIPDEIILEDKIQKDLENFAYILRSFQGNNSLAQYALDTEDRGTIKNNKSSNINKEDMEDKIDAFIQAIKTRDLEYFEKVKDIGDGEIYKHLEIAFHKDKDIDEGYFIGRDLFDYYNVIHEQKFTNKKQFMDKLKDEDNMFKQEVKTLKILDKDQKEEVLFQAYETSKEIKHKELYKIIKPKMAKDIIIPYGSTVISSQENFRKFAHEDMEDIDNCIKRTKEYRVKKAKEKEQK